MANDTGAPKNPGPRTGKTDASGTSRASSRGGSTRKTSKPVIIDVEPGAGSGKADASKAAATPTAGAKVDAANRGPKTRTPNPAAAKTSVPSTGSTKTSDAVTDAVKAGETAKTQSKTQSSQTNDSVEKASVEKASVEKNSGEEAKTETKTETKTENAGDAASDTSKALDETPERLKALQDAPSDGSSSDMPPPEAVVADTAGKSGPSAFFVFSAGLVGALLAFVLMFLGLQTGLIGLPGRLDNSQALDVAALEARIAGLEADLAAAADVSGPMEESVAMLDSALGSLQEDMVDLRSELVALQAVPPVDTDGEPATNLGEVVAPLLAPVSARLDALEQQGAAAEAEPFDPAPLQGAIDTVSADVSAVQAALDALAGQSAELPQEALARLDALDAALAEDTQTMTAVLSQVADLSEAVSALASAPIPQTPDLVARLGIAIDALARARDGEGDLAAAVDAAQQAANLVDPSQNGAAALLATVATLDGLAGLPSVSDGALRGLYQDVAPAMQAAAPQEDGLGLMAALEERARQIVTIRAPGGDLALGGNTALAALEELGVLVDLGRVNDALATFQTLPEAMQAAGDVLGTALAARVALDGVLAEARGAFMTMLGQPVAGQSTVTRPADAAGQ
ncbi:MAG: hypothetical protein AAF590_06730 [Pseudomonadota bacterium]